MEPSRHPSIEGRYYWQLSEDPCPGGITLHVTPRLQRQASDRSVRQLSYAMDGNAQKTFVSWSRIALNEDGSNEPVVTACLDHDLAVAS